MKVTKKILNRLLALDGVNEFITDGKFVKCYFLTDEPPTLENSSLMLIPLNGWHEEIRELLVKEYPNIKEGLYSGPDITPITFIK